MSTASTATTAKHEQPGQTEPNAAPPWIREPEAPEADPKQTSAEPDVSQPPEEPGYGHGV